MLPASPPPIPGADLPSSPPTMHSYQSGAPVVASHVAGVSAAALAAAARGPGQQAPPMTAAFRRPGSAMRLATANGAVQPGQGGLGAVVQVDFRPVTQHGMTGMRTSNQGQGRQFADTSFFVAELRNKITEVTEELSSLQLEHETLSRDQGANAHLVRKYEDMAKTVQTLEGQLADYNLAHDKVRMGTDLRDLAERCLRMQQQNDQQKHEIDELFLSRSNQDALRLKLEGDIAAIIAKEELCMNQVDGATKRDYVALKEESKQQLIAVQKKEETIMELQLKLAEQEAALRKDEYRVHFKGIELSKEREELEGQKRELREECDANLTVEQMRDRLQMKAKEDAVIVKAMEERSRSLDAEHEQLQEQIREREEQKENMKEFEDVTKKYEALYQRDKAMTDFMDKFESTRSRDLEQQKIIQARIVTLLEHIGEGVLKKENLPNTKQVSAMEHDLTFKSKELDASQLTLERVKKELDKRRAEMEQVSGLGEKIKEELINLSSRVAQMQSELPFLSDIEGMKTREAQTMKALSAELVTFKHKRAAIQVQVQALSKQFDQKKKVVSDDEDWKRLETLEAKLRTYAQTVFALESHIAARKRESDYESIRDQVINLTSQVNALLLDQHSS